MTASGAGSTPAGQRGNRPAATVCASGRRRSWARLPPSGRWTAVPTARSSRPRLSPFSPLRYGLGIDTQFPAQLSERSLRLLYWYPDGVRGLGAPVTNPSHCAFFHSCEKDRTIKPRDQRDSLDSLKPGLQKGGRGWLIGRTKGGLNSKLHVFADANGRRSRARPRPPRPKETRARNAETAGLRHLRARRARLHRGDLGRESPDITNR